jgi:DNA polymerase
VLPIVRGTSPTVLFLGEAPGGTEDKKGEPFCGSAGKWHWWFANEIGVADSCVVGNCINCRPVVLKGKRKVNGKPTDDQLMNCSHWRNMLIRSYSFKLIILYGTYPIAAMLDLHPPVSKWVGRKFVNSKIGIPLLACYHPATLVYDYKEYISAWEEHTKIARKLLYEEN